MDRPAARPGFPRPGDLARLLAPFPGRGEMTLRLTVICALTALVASAYGTPEAALSVYIAFFLIRSDRVLSAILPAMMLLLVSVILGVILLVTTASIDYPILRVSAMALLSAGFLFLASASKLAHRRHPGDDCRLRAGPDGPRADRRGQHPHAAVCVAAGGHPGRRGHRRRPAAGAFATTPRL